MPGLAAFQTVPGRGGERGAGAGEDEEGSTVRPVGDTAPGMGGAAGSRAEPGDSGGSGWEREK